ncbi:zinc finger CCCH domain-containing protein 28-like isoform X2 [Asparagus officinalis]|uniref:zinc finger CCCH domain-containing protein 28-like isoform X2 n=1 Tax=Asparagus officinalis TaxID=4686 RepID=UPI00098E8468|nr:zinc finger CCCH domain-containing protein 28-like isoform X2 [Asparagus officinalis]
MSPRKRERSQTPSSPSSSPIAPRKRERSQTPNSSSDSEQASSKRCRVSDLAVEVCKEFTRNSCKRSEIDCKFAHPHSAVAVVKDKVIACADSLRNKCYRGRTCRYYHPPPHIQQSLLKAIGVEHSEVETVCKDFLRGRCLRSASNCRFAHHMPIDHCAVVCQDFVRGSCERKSCRYSHVLAAEIPEVCQDFLRGKCEHRPCRYSHFVVPQMPQVCQDFSRGNCERRTCRYSHVLVPETSHAPLQQCGRPMVRPSSPPQTGKGQEILQVCRDFLNKMCKRDSCKYAHPESKTKRCIWLLLL